MMRSRTRTRRGRTRYEAEVTRRKLIGCGLGWLAACATRTSGRRTTPPGAPWYRVGRGLPAGRPSDVQVAEGLRWYPIARVGDRPFIRPEDYLGADHDFTAALPLSEGRALLWVNHEAPPGTLAAREYWPHLPRAPTADDIRYSMGASVLEIVRADNGDWSVVPQSSRNWRLSGFGPGTRVTGPATSLLGREVMGTMWNCGGGVTPWGTVLTCEENFRYQVPEGLGSRDGKVGSEGPVAGDRIPGLRGEQYGWVVEVDPADPDWSPRRHTALGRMRHESAAVVAVPGQPLVVYMADDRNGGGLWRYRSLQPYRPEGGREGGSALLETGILEIARFGASAGIWVPVRMDSATDGGRVGGFALSQAFVDRARAASTLSQVYDSEAALLVDAFVAGMLAGGTGLGNPEGVVATGNRVVVGVTAGCRLEEAQRLAHNPELGFLLEIVDRGETFTWRALADSGEDWGNPDNVAIVEGGALFCTDGVDPEQAGWGSDALYLAGEADVVRLFQAPPGAEVAGPSLAPDGETLFLSLQHPIATWGPSMVVGMRSA